MRSPEHNLQCACVRWFGVQYPRLRLRLFAVPNGGQRNAAVAARLKAEGVLPGVSDLILLVPRSGYGALCIEMKTVSKSSRQSPRQKEWEADITRGGEYRYAVCRNVDEFIETVNGYLNGNDEQE